MTEYISYGKKESMTQTVEAIFRNGAFRPIAQGDLHLHEGQNVRITIETPDEPSDILELATSVYEGLTDAEINEIEEIAFDRTSFFRDRE